MSQIDSRTTGKIAEESQQDAISMRTIAFVTMFFLPATFVSSFFDITFFQSGVFTEVSFVWIYFVVVIILTIVVLLVWHFWLQFRMKRTGVSEARHFLDFPSRIS